MHLIHHNLLFIFLHNDIAYITFYFVNDLSFVVCCIAFATAPSSAWTPLLSCLLQEGKWSLLLKILETVPTPSPEMWNIGIRLQDAINHMLHSSSSSSTSLTPHSREFYQKLINRCDQTMKSMMKSRQQEVVMNGSHDDLRDGVVATKLGPFRALLKCVVCYRDYNFNSNLN